MSDRNQSFHGSEIAIVGMAIRFPKARTPEELWAILRDGLEGISYYSDEEVRRAGRGMHADKPNFVAAYGELEGIDQMDAPLFGFSPNEAKITDPQHRLFLECAWEALEHAGYDPESFPGAIGVYAGAAPSTYLFNIYGSPEGREILRRVGETRVVLGNDKDYMPTWTSYLLNLKGPSVCVSTACSTSLVAVHIASQSLINGECDIALAGGVTVDVRPVQHKGYFHHEGGILSPDGHCRPFDADARGTVGSSGLGVVVLRRLSDALSDGDHIHAVLKGTAINNDGSAKAGYTAPSIEGQSSVIREAISVADVDPESISYVEAHGTGTEIGDPIEIKALTEAFRSFTDAQGFCGVGSVKSNLGHTDIAAGMAGLVKTVLAIEHGQLPASLHFKRTNPRIDLESSPFFINHQLRPWESGSSPRRAGVSSFGIGGTNAHVIVEEAPPPLETTPGRAAQLLVLSARTEAALEKATSNLAEHLEAHSEIDLADAAYTLQIGRKGLMHRRMLACRDFPEAVAALRSRDPRQVLSALTDLRHRGVAFMFPGQGAQHVGMARSLYDTEPTFREEVDRCAEILKPHLGLELRELLYPMEETEEIALRLQSTAVAQAALFVVEYCLARLWMEWGIRPESMIGHSVGEYVAACLAGVFSLEDALRLVAARGRLMQSMPEGAMLAVHLDEPQLVGMLGPGLFLAAVNGPRLCVASGTFEAIAGLEKQLGEEGVKHRRLHTSHAFHSEMMEPILEAFREELSGMTLQQPRMPWVSNLTGTRITAEQAVDPAYWSAHLRGTVRFADGLSDLLQDPEMILLEIGPGRTLSTLARQSGPVATSRLVLTSLPYPQDQEGGDEDLLKTLGRLWLAGVRVDWRGFHRHEVRRRVVLPSYPFERQRYWIEPAQAQPEEAARVGLEVRESAPEVSEAPPEMALALEKRPSLSTAYVAPANDVEQRIARIWQEFLGVEEVGAHDDFFELGGHSLLLIEVVERMRQEFSVELTMRSVIEHATIAELAEEILRTRSIAREEPVFSTLPTVVPAPAERYEPFPLTEVQEAYWIGRSGMFQLGNVATQEYSERDVHVDIGRLVEALRSLIDRHDMLRAIVLPDGFQKVLERVPPYRPTVIDLRGAPRETVEEVTQQIRQHMSHQVLPADQWPLFDLRITRLEGDLCRIHLSIDMLIADVWSIQILSRELLQLYAGLDSALPAIELTFRDYVMTEVEYRESPEYRRALAYWRGRLPTLPGAPELPLVANAASLTNPRFVRLRSYLEKAVWKRLKARSSEAGLMPSGVLLAAYADVLTAWSKSPRFLLNLTLFNRLPFHPHVDRVVGDFTSLTLVEVDNSGPASFRDRARRLQDRLWEDLEHRFVSGIRVLRELMREKGGRVQTLAPVVFTSTLFMSAGDTAAQDESGDASPPDQGEHGISQTPQVWLDLGVAEESGHLVFSWDVVEDLFPPGVVRQIFGAYCSHLRRLCDDDQAWEQLALGLVPIEQLELQAAANATAAAVPEPTLHALFAAQAAERPDHPAVLARGRAITYGELYRTATRLGRRLRDLGARPNQLVAVVMEKGWEQIAAVLGILEAGAAYLPIDPSLPGERVAYLLRQGRVELALVQPGLPLVPEWSGDVQRLPLDEEEWLAGVSAEPLQPVQGADALAYVIFTSGSTGQPKGVMIDHRGAVNTILDINERFAVGPEDRVLALSALNFDLSVYDVFGILAAGGTLVLPDAAASKEPGLWADLMLRERVTIWNSVPALMAMLVDFVSGRSGPLPPSLRIVLMSGDWIPVGLPDRIRSLWPEAEVVSLGGATEASIWSILYPIGEVDPSWTSIPYGKPMANQRFYVLNELLEPAPVWVPGHLYIGGVGLAKGYWEDEEKTARSFVPHSSTGERLYRTGDLGRWLPDGNIEFLGREDQQVKVQGYRIELGEIETALSQHPAIRAAAVAAVGEQRGEKRLVAYVVPEQSALPEPTPDGPAAADHSFAGALVLDPIQRLEFKVQQRGLRRDSGQATVELVRAPQSEESLRSYTERRSHRRFLPGTVPVQELSELLGKLSEADLHGRPKYRYPSAGSLYPVQVYLHVKEGKVESLPGGTYYYHPKEHRLVLLAPEARIDPRLWGDENRPVFEQASFGLFLIADYDAITPLYGQRARDFCLIEAGCILQLLMTSAAASRLGLCPIGGLEFGAVRHQFALSEHQELLHVILGGAVAPLQTWVQAEDEDYQLFLQLVRAESGQRRAPAQLATPGPSRAAAARTDDLVEELRSFLPTKLPEYMVPTSFRVLDALPLTANGKLDRQVLSRFEQEEKSHEKVFVAPRTPLETEVAALWCDVLGGETIGVRDDFFEAGGHSLLAARLIARVRERFGVELPLGTIFEAPDVAGMAEAIARRQAESPARPTSSPALPVLVADRERLHEPFPLTDLQQGYWIGGTGAFELGNLAPQFYLELEVTELSVERLQRALERLIARHDMLRAVVLPDGRQQILRDLPPFAIEPRDLRGLAPADREAALLEVSAAMTRRVADSAQWPLFDVRVCRLEESRFRIHVSVNLLICDAWSSGIFGAELSRFYAAPDAELPAIGISYRDYVLATAALEETETYRRSLDYWRGRLQTLPPTPELPIRRLPGLGEHPGFVRRTDRLEPEAWRRFKRRAVQVGLTPDAALCALYAAVLGRWSKQPHFTLNILYFNRQPLHPDVNLLLGNLSSTILLEVDTGAAPTFEGRARRLQQQLWQDLEHGQVSGVRVLREIGRQQGRPAGALVPVVFASTVSLNPSEEEDAPAEGRLGGIVASHLQTPQVWLDHQVHEDHGGLRYNWDSVDSIFPPGLVDEMYAAYRRLLEQLSAERADWRQPPPSLLPAAQLALREQVNATDASFPAGLLQDAFEARATEQPERWAVLSPRFALSYGDLLRRSRGLGRLLREAGARPNTLVAVVMEKGWEQVVAALAVLQSGAAYLPIDPELPAERLHYLLRQGEVELALSQPWIDERLDWPTEVRRMVVTETPATADESPLAAAQKPEDLAYVIFTSGSTGLPKGVMIEHRGALNTITDVNRRFAMGPDDRVLGLSSLSFDLSVWDVFGLLSAGGTLVLPEPAALREPGSWAALVEEHRVTVWNTVPALMEMLVDHLAGRSAPLPASLRLVLMSGDWIPVTLPDRIREMRPGIEVLSLGGATEASIWSICHPIGPVDPTWKSIPYGRPMVNQRMYVLDKALEPTPDWVSGDLYIAGAGLARGYWRDEEKTSASFLCHPRTGERLYRTGDLGCWLPEGDIEFLGREDLQVKVQGYRIELGEIEAALARHSGVRAGVAMAVGETHGNKSLVAYVVPDSQQPPTIEELREFLHQRLPGYMVPPVFHLLSELPLTANGKVDRGSLELAGDTRSDRRGAYVPPRDELELQLVQLWEEILGVQSVSVTDSFFEIGGHSLRAVQLMGRIQQRLGWDLPLSVLFEGGTVERLAALLRQKPGSVRRSALVSIRPGSAKSPLFWAHPVGGDVLCYVELARYLDPGRPFYGLQVPDDEDGSASLEVRAARYVAEVMRIQPEGQYHLGGWSMGGVLAYEMAQQLRREGREVALLALVDTEVPAGNSASLEDASLVTWFARDLGALVGRSLTVSPERLASLSPDEQLHLVLEEARKAGILPPDTELGRMRRHLEIFKANARALHAYAPVGYPGRVVLLRAGDVDGNEKDPALGWRRLAGDVDVRVIEGDHYSIIRSPQVILLAEHLQPFLEEC